MEMDNSVLNCRTVFSTRFGRCEKCMRQSLTGALAAWGLFGIGLAAWPNGVVHMLSGLLALGLTALWMLHVSTYAFRNFVARMDKSVDRVGRRRTLVALARAAGIGLIASAPALLWPSKGFAYCGQCTKNADCGEGWSCKNTAAVNSGEVCNECVQD